MSLNTEESENTEQNEMRELREQLDQTKGIVLQLSQQLSELRDRVRRQAFRPGCLVSREGWREGEGGGGGGGGGEGGFIEHCACCRPGLES